MATEKLVRLKAKQAQLAARIRQEENRARTRERKEDTRRKILAGAAVLDEAEHHPEFNVALIGLLGRFLLRPDDRALFGLLPSEKPEEAAVSSPSPMAISQHIQGSDSSEERIAS
jgi:hypothetical protein